MENFLNFPSLNLRFRVLSIKLCENGNSYGNRMPYKVLDLAEKIK